MSHKWALLVLGLVALVFLIGITDLTIADTEDTGTVPARITSIAGVILSGVAIGSILAGLRRNGGGSGTDGSPSGDGGSEGGGDGGGEDDDPEDAMTDRARQTARIHEQVQQDQQEEG